MDDGIVKLRDLLAKVLEVCPVCIVIMWLDMF